MNEVKEMYVCEGARTSYSFLHLSIQEFLAAWHVSKHPELSPEVCSCYAYHHVHLEMFLFGIMGPIASETNILLEVGEAINRHMTYIDQLFRCLYEAQNSKIVSILSVIDLIRDVAMNNPFDLYVFGYILVHSPMSWVVAVIPSLEMLISSLKDHASSDHKILGSISKLILHGNYNHFELANLPSCPSCVTEHMTSITIVSILNSYIPVLSEWISTLSDLYEICLGYEEPCEDEYLLYQSLKRLTKLGAIEITCFGCSSRGAQELSKFISNSFTLEEVSLKYTCLSSVNNMFELDSVVEAVLSSSTVTSLKTNFPFQIRDFMTILNNSSLLSLHCKY